MTNIGSGSLRVLVGVLALVCATGMPLVKSKAPTVNGFPVPGLSVDDASAYVRTAEDLVVRLLGKERLHQFSFDVIPTVNRGCLKPVTDWAIALFFFCCKDPLSGRDVFELEQNGDKVAVRGNTGVAMASGLYHYLKVYGNCSMTWGVNGTGDQLFLPLVLPRVEKAERIVAQVQLRYAWNVCTFDYTAAFWDWERWER